MKKILFALSLILSAKLSIAQIKEGSITYNVTMEGLPPEQAAMMDGTEQKTTFKNNKSKIEFTNAFVSTTTVFDGSKMVTLMDQMGQKTYFEMTSDEMNKKAEKSPKSEIEYKDETKKIAGYDCKKAIIKSKDDKGEETVMNVWFTESLPNLSKNSGRNSGGMKELKGAPLEFEAKQGPFFMKFTATEISTKEIDDAEFKVSTDGYIKRTPPEEGKKMSEGK
jgi:hypothetical protein